MNECVFCAIASKKVQSFLVYEDNLSFACLDIQPANIGHVILFPKRHVSNFLELNEEEIKSLSSALKKICSAISLVGLKNFMVLNLVGGIAGQKIPHMLIHIIPRSENDNVQVSWTGKKIDEETFKKIQTTLINAISKIDTMEKKEESKIEKVITEKVPDYWT
jgi:histidine triad (HIT) family protein